MFFLFNTWFRYWIVWIFLLYIMQIVYIANWCTWLARTLCEGSMWNYKSCWAQPWLSFGTLQTLRYFFWPIHDFVLKFWNLHYYHLLERRIHLFFKELFRFFNCLHIFADFVLFFSFGWWDTLMKNKHQISLHLGSKKNGQHFADNIFKWIFL